MPIAVRFYDRKTGIYYTKEELPPEQLEALKKDWYVSLANLFSGHGLISTEWKGGGINGAKS